MSNARIPKRFIGQLTPGFAAGRYAFVFISAIGLGLGGCGSGHELETAEVQGVVTFDGKPVQQGSVTFVPERGRGATGSINADGSYTVTTYHPGDGALIGPHTVTVFPKYAQHELDEVRSDAQMVPRPYGGISVTVEAGKVNQLDLHVSSAP